MSTLDLTPILRRSAYFTISTCLVWLGLDTYLSGQIWSGMTVSQSAVQVEYCEFNHTTRFFHQPINTYSNLAYFFFGMLISLIAWQDYRAQDHQPVNRLAGFPLLSALMGICFIYLSLGSAFFHASLTYLGQRVDMNGTYSLLITLLGIALYHVFYSLRLTASQKSLWIGILIVFILLFLPLSLRIPSSRLVPTLILLLNGAMLIHYFQFRKERSIVLVILGFILVIVAIKIRTLDVQKVNCDPYSFYQGHALWHILTALSSFCSYSFFRFTVNRIGK